MTKTENCLNALSALLRVIILVFPFAFQLRSPYILLLRRFAFSLSALGRFYRSAEIFHFYDLYIYPWKLDIYLRKLNIYLLLGDK